MEAGSSFGSSSSNRTSSGGGSGSGSAGPTTKERRASPTKPATMTHKMAGDLRGVFELLDKDGSGFITKRRLAMLLAELDGDLDVAGLKGVLDAVDVDSDGNIDLKRFLSMMEDTSEGIDSEESMKSAFKIFDPHEHGFISGKDLQRVMGSIGDEPTPDEAKRMIDAADRTGDGMLDLDEFTHMMKK